MTPFDLQLARRTVAFSALATVLGLVVVITTDEAYSTASMRAARMAAFAPALTAIGVLAACAQASSRRELRALAALGAPPAATVRGARYAAWALGVLAVGVVASPWADVASLFPVAETGVEWRAEASGYSSTVGVWVGPTGDIVQRAASITPEVAYQPRLSAVLMVAALAMAAPVWATLAMSPTQRAVTALLTAAVVISIFQALASGRLPSWVAVFAPCPLVAHAVVARFRPGFR